MIKGFDCATPLTQEKADAFKKSGYDFVCRYLVPATSAWKALTKQEADIIKKSGLNIVSVFETSAGRPKGGAVNGTADGKVAFQVAKQVGQPEGSTIYFAVDYQATAADIDLVEAYLKAAKAQITGYEIGVYGSFYVIEEMHKRGAAKYFWQTYAWSVGKKSEYTNIYQYKNGQQLFGYTVDLDESYGNEGWWGNVPQKLTKFKDVDAGRWSEHAIAEMVAKNIMNGATETVFNPAGNMTREQFAAAVSKLFAYLRSKGINC